ASCSRRALGLTETSPPPAARLSPRREGGLAPWGLPLPILCRSGRKDTNGIAERGDPAREGQKEKALHACPRADTGGRAVALPRALQHRPGAGQTQEPSTRAKHKSRVGWDTAFGRERWPGGASVVREPAGLSPVRSISVNAVALWLVV